MYKGLSGKFQIYMRKFISILPKKVKYPLMRSKLNLNLNLPKDIVFKVAQTDDELKQAFRILYDSYIEVGLMQPNEIKMRITDYHYQSTSVVLIVKKGDEVIGTCTIVRDNPEVRLPADKIYDLSFLRSDKNVIAEISGLSIKKEWRGKLFLTLIKYIYEYAFKHLNITTFIAVAHSDWFQFYEGLGLFTPLKEEKIEKYNFSNNVPVKGLYLDLTTGPELYYYVYGKKKKPQNLYEFLVRDECLNFDFSNHREYYSIINPAHDSKILEKKPKNDFDNQRFFKRIESFLEAQIIVSTNSLETIEGKVLDISLSGFKFYPNNKKNSDLIEGQFTRAKVIIGPLNISELKVKLIWVKDANCYGFKIIQHDKKWIEYLNFLKINKDEIQNHSFNVLNIDPSNHNSRQIRKAS